MKIYREVVLFIGLLLVFGFLLGAFLLPFKVYLWLVVLCVVYRLAFAVFINEELVEDDWA